MHNILILVILVGIVLVGGGLFFVFQKGRIKFHSQSHKNNKSAIKDDRQQLSVIFNSIEDGVILVDEKGTIQLFNPSASKITAWDINDANGVDIRSVIKLVDEKGKTLSENDNPLIKVFSVRQPMRVNNIQLLNRNKRLLSVSISVSPLYEGEEITSAVALIRDVTEEMMKEGRLADFISTASHEMRTPVAAIEGYLALALNDKVATIDKRARDFLEKAHEATQHLGELFQDLLTSAKAEDGRLTSHPTVIEIGSLLKKLSEDLKFAAEKRQLTSDFVVGSKKVINANASSESGEKEITPLYYVYADADRLREVVTNLFDNAVKYTNSGKITIGLTGDNQVVQFYVKDTGAGIDAEDVPHLFQKFYRVDNSATRTIGGTGLGLFICKKIVELYNGRIWVESTVSKGSTFYINMPRLTPQQAKQLSAESAAVTVTPLTSTGTLS